MKFLLADPVALKLAKIIPQAGEITLEPFFRTQFGVYWAPSQQNSFGFRRLLQFLGNRRIGKRVKLPHGPATVKAF